MTAERTNGRRLTLIKHDFRAAVVAYNVRLLHGKFVLAGFDRLFGVVELSAEAFVEIGESGFQRRFSALDVVEFLLHLSGVLIIDDIGERVLHQFRRYLTEGSRNEALALAVYVTSCEYYSDDRIVGARSADALLLEEFDEGCLGISRGRLGEMLVCAD